MICPHCQATVLTSNLHATPAVGGERLWCSACGTVTRDMRCDCNRWPDGHEMKREPHFVNYAGKECPGDDDRWRVVENKYSFTVECDRPRPHITIVYGDGPMNIPNYGTKDQARADAETIAKALNARDMPASPPEPPAAPNKDPSK